MVWSFEVVVYLFAQQLNLNEIQNITTNSLKVVAELVRPLPIVLLTVPAVTNSLILQRTVMNLAQTGKSFAIGSIANTRFQQMIIHLFCQIAGNNEFEIEDEDQVKPGQLTSKQDAAISLPASLFQSITDREDVGIFFALYNESTLFPVKGERNRSIIRRPEVGSRVLAATVGPDLNFENLEDNVTVVLRLVTQEVKAACME